MRDFKPDTLIQICGRLERTVGFYFKEGWDENRREQLCLHFNDLIKACNESGFKTTAQHAASTLSAIEDKAYEPAKHLERDIAVIRRSVGWETNSLLYFEIPLSEVHYWTNLEPFGAAINAKFPSAAYDIEHASKCIAVDMYTASVFHSMRVLERAINALWLSLGGTPPEEHERTWGKVLKKTKEQIELRVNSKMQEWIVRTPAMETAHAFLISAKTAWRDDTMHVGPKYDDKEAIRIFSATKNLMEHISEWINEDGKWLKP